jgi:hypothetical protein
MRRALLALLALTVTLTAVAAPAAAAELRVSYAAIKKALGRQFFVEQGRHYLMGSTESSCNYAYLENPEVFPQDARLNVRMQFTSKQGAPVAGRCVGPGDSFTVSLSGVPVYADGVLRLSDLKVETGNRAYNSLVAPFLTGALGDALQFPLQQRIEEGAQAVWAQTGISLKMPQLDVSQIQLGVGQIVVPFEFRMELY